WGQRDDDEIEAERRANRAAFAEGERDVAAEQGEDGSHRARVFPSASLCASLVLSGVWLGTTALPPFAGWAPIAPASSLTEAASSETCGSSSTQMGRGAAKRRESASLCFCPAESRPAGRSPRALSPKAASAFGRSPRLAPRKSAQKARFSATVRLD